VTKNAFKDINIRSDCLYLQPLLFTVKNWVYSVFFYLYANLQGTIPVIA